MGETIALGLQFGSRLCAVGRESSEFRKLDYEAVHINGDVLSSQLRQVSYLSPTAGRANEAFGLSALKRATEGDCTRLIASPRELLLARGSGGPLIGGRLPSEVASGVLNLVLRSAAPHPDVTLTDLWCAVPDGTSPEQQRWLLDAVRNTEVGKGAQSIAGVPESAAAFIGCRGAEAVSELTYALLCDWGWSGLRLALIAAHPPADGSGPAVRVLARRTLPMAGGAAIEDDLIGCWIAAAEREGRSSSTDVSADEAWVQLEKDMSVYLASSPGMNYEVELDGAWRTFSLQPCLNVLLDRHLSTLLEHAASMACACGLVAAPLPNLYFVGGYAAAGAERAKAQGLDVTLPSCYRTAVACGAAAMAACAANMHAHEAWRVLEPTGCE